MTLYVCHILSFPWPAFRRADAELTEPLALGHRLRITSGMSSVADLTDPLVRYGDLADKWVGGGYWTL